MEQRNFFSVDYSRIISKQENFEEFLNRIFSFQRPYFNFGVERFVPSQSVKQKVDINGNFNNFFGDTVVFDLDSSQKRFIEEYYINPLYWVGSNCLAEKLKEQTLHMTLHDLNSGTTVNNDLMSRLFHTELVLSKMISSEYFRSESITMETTCVFNMVNTSIVLGLKPKKQEDYDKLMKIYGLIENIYHLPYPFTPHITLAYFNQNGFEGEQLEHLQNTINDLNHETFEITLSTNRLFYQKFISMNDYFSIMSFVK